MKSPLPYLLLCMALSGCATTVTTRPLEGGGTVTTTEKGLTDRAAGISVRLGDRLLDRYLGADVETKSSK
jgi:hypothetical protein